jgi:hypothetical protein
MAVAAKGRDKNALAEIVGWCGELPGWQQDAMRRIVECCDLTAKDIGELVALCKHGHGLEVEDVPALHPFRPEHVPKGTAAGKAVTLCSIARHASVPPPTLRQTASVVGSLTLRQMPAVWYATPSCGWYCERKSIAVCTVCR